VLAHWSNSPRIDMSSHTDTLSWLRDNQSLLFPNNTASLVDKQQIPILYLWFDPIWIATNDLPQSRGACYPLHHRCGLFITELQSAVCRTTHVVFTLKIFVFVCSLFTLFVFVYILCCGFVLFFFVLCPHVASFSGLFICDSHFGIL
jgi:hypothetical protein